MLDLVQNPGECILKRKNTSKLGCTRTYYPDGYRKRAAGLCFKSESKNEAGVTGKVIGTLGPFDDITVNGTKHRTSVYIFVVTEEFDLWEDKLRIGRTRKWFPIEDAFKQLHRYKPNQESYLREAIMDT
ncbi:Diphosphoinositol polyphosphate phosphohydrolase 1 [Holothuria leucospilota]|uniref:Diphosphoinositol polyphosphate phosphohydrolase 1 n=1 Tax=Holothuria leucospilota TaxID=206669 RepID=A0A9Q1H5B0_HOLLE|nr:Diphosphoinositol polyphosphate phosphohydrolase 1 [Holothuria leucospilota]